MFTRIKESAFTLWRTPPVRAIFLPWAIAFVILQLVNTQDGGMNANSRFLTMRAMAEEGSFAINGHIRASDDWSLTPDGNYYSNKAPGPMLLGFPTFLVIDQIPRLWEKGYRDEHGLRHTPGYFQKTTTSFVNQILPLLLLTALAVRWLSAQGVRRETQVFFLLAVFFGSTASLYFNNYSGHGFTAILQLGMLFALLRRKYGWVGFFSGAALLSDYGFGVQIPAFLAALAVSFAEGKRFWRPLASVCLGAIGPAALWIWYHVACFGGPFSIPNDFQNPVYLDTIQETRNLWGIFRLPQLDVLRELLFGQSRGLLFTQPWILLAIPMGIYTLPQTISDLRRGQEGTGGSRLICVIFCLFSLAGLLLMNMSFGGWHGGGASGPRYLSGVFLCFALWVALELDRFPRPLRSLFWIALIISLVFRALVYGTTILGPVAPLWQWYLFTEFAKPSGTPWLRFSVFGVLLIVTWLWQKKCWSKKMAFKS